MAFNMNDGFVEYLGQDPIFIAQQRLFPGSRISFNEAYSAFGKRSDKTRGSSFIFWLRENIFPGEDWHFYAEPDKAFFDSTKNRIDPMPVKSTGAVDPGRGAGQAVRKQGRVRAEDRIITAVDIVEAPYEKARQLIEDCKDLRQLRLALRACQIRYGKEAHQRDLLRKIG